MIPVTEPMDAPSNPRKTLFIAVILAMLAGMLLSVIYLSLATSRLATAETLKLGDSLAQQSETLIRPLILSNDRVSLNFLLNELVQAKHVEGLQVNDRNGIVIARAGDISDLKQVRHLLQQNKNIGSFTLWLNPAPTQKLLSSQHIPLLILACMSGLFILLAIWYTTRLTTDTTAIEPEESNNHTPSEFSAALALETGQRSSAMEETPSGPSPEQRDTLSESKQSTADTPVLGTADLVDLLKPEPTATPQMPKFEHQPQELDSSQKAVSEDALVFEEQDLKVQNPPPAANNAKANPLFRMQEQHENAEQQLELYSFEHELELILPPQDALYLFYIDTLTASSDNISGEEKSALVNVYFHLARQVARIYKGEAEQLENNDILLHFEMRDEQDSHGINALCAAVLFNLLYKGFNQSRIKGFQPVLSLQMSIARGHHSRYNLVQEEAHFLTRTTHSNELISHTALSEAPIIKQTLLESSDIRREDEDKVLIMKLTAKHQTLLQKQANHLLTKIFQK